MARLTIKYSVLLLQVLFTGVMTIAAQEFGGDLGGSATVFRPKNPSANASRKSSKPADSKPRLAKTKEVKRSENHTETSRTATRTPVKSRLKTVSRTSADKSLKTPSKSETVRIKSVGNTGKSAETYEQALAAGNDARDERIYSVAESAYRRAFRINAKDSRAVYGLGNLYIDQQMWDEAEKYYRQAVKLDGKNADAHIALSYVLVQPNGSGNVAEKFVEAEQAARTAIALNSANPLAHDQLGVALESRGIIGEDAENAYKRAISLDKNYAVAYAHYGRLMRKRGNLKAAAAAFEQAHKLADDIPSMILFAEILQTEQRISESEKILRRVLQQDANNPTALMLLGRALSMTNGETEAREILEKAIRISPRSFLPYSLLGGLLLKKGDIARAEQIYLRALTIASPNEKRQIVGTFGFLGIGDGYLKSNRRADALRAYRKALEIDPKNQSALSKIAANDKK